MITTTITTTGAGTGTKHTHSSARSVDFLFSQERIKNLQVDVYTHTQTRGTPAHSHRNTHTQRHMWVRFEAHARKTYPFCPKKWTECQAYSRHTCNNFMAWQRPRSRPRRHPFPCSVPLPSRHLDSGSHKISGEKRNETKAGGGRRRPETWRKTKPERSNIKIHDAKHKTKSAWPGTATTKTTTTTAAKKYTKTKRTKTTLIADTMTWRRQGTARGADGRKEVNRDGVRGSYCQGFEARKRAEHGWAGLSRAGLNELQGFAQRRRDRACSGWHRQPGRGAFMWNLKRNDNLRNIYTHPHRDKRIYIHIYLYIRIAKKATQAPRQKCYSNLR